MNVVTALPHTARVETALTRWLPWQRWYAGKDRPLARAEIAASHTVSERGSILLVRARFADGGEDQHYQVPIGMHPADTPPDGAHLIAVHDDSVLAEGLSDAGLVRDLLARVATDRDHPELAFSSEPHCAAWPPRDEPVDCRPLGAEQSNTSVVADDRYLLKVFRQLHPGTNPEVELTRALRAAGNPHTAPLYGAVHAELPGGPVTLAVVQGFLPGATDGWSAALAALRPGPLQGEFAQEAYAMGQAVAAVHLDLAEQLGTDRMHEDYLPELAAAFLTRLDTALRHVPGLAPYEDALREAYELLGEVPPDLAVQRVHGDLHLGQLLRSGPSWTVIDFEGEPSCAMSLRAERHSPLRDVAGMLRSFDYAAHHSETAAPGPAAAWAAGTQAAFCRGYADGSGQPDWRQEELLRAYVLDKAVYEAVYETRNRPAWARIPLSAIARLTAGQRA